MNGKTYRELPAFCKHCGRKLIKKEKLTGYNIICGEISIETRLICPKKSSFLETILNFGYNPHDDISEEFEEMDKV